jgi:hypothetical protein
MACCLKCSFEREPNEGPVGFFSRNRMILCANCGNKRCPHATDHRNPCTGSNAPGQPGSIYGTVDIERSLTSTEGQKTC